MGTNLQPVFRMYNLIHDGSFVESNVMSLEKNMDSERNQAKGHILYASIYVKCQKQIHKHKVN